ncbi:Moulting cycle MLT-10-like protein family-containing protein [Aphelenchoides fujianensis]|nr:Moulting cycle MLT-10-like protein family-containing protein [Aphelenchoides fujianensis]
MTHESKVEKKEYVLNTRHLGLLFHRATSAALLQAKAKKELRKLPASETLVFEACAKDARTLLNPKQVLAAKSKTILRGRYNRTRLLNSKLPSKSANFEWKKRRVVRSTQPTSPRCKTPKSVQKLRNVDGYFKKMNEVLNFVYGVSKSNERFLNEADARAKYRFQPTGAPNPTEKLRSFIEELENYQDKAVISFLSPQLLNLLPQRPLDPDSQNVLSPNMLSFQDEGMLPLPRLLQMSTSDHCETLEWLDLLMEMTGGTRMLTSLMQRFGDHMTKVEEEIHPRVRRAHAHDQKFLRLDSLTHEEQRRELEEHGYARMNKQQMEMIYGKEARPEADDGQPFEYRADELTERAFENEIRQIARMTEEKFLRMSKQTAVPAKE